MEVLDMYISLIALFDDWKLEVMWSFIDALSMMVDGWPCLSSFDPMIQLVFESSYFECFLMVWSLLDPFGLSLTPHKPSNMFTLFTLQRLAVFIILIHHFSKGLCSMMLIMSRTIFPRIFKFISFRLIRFWELWLFNYPLDFTLYFPTLKLMD